MLNEDLEVYTEEYFRRGSRGSSYTEDYWMGTQEVIEWFMLRFKLIEKDVAASKVVLDVGCGVGHSSMILRRIGGSAHVIALDISKDAIERAKNLYGDDVLLDFIIADAQNIPIRRGSANLAVAVALYEHLECPVKFLREISVVSKKLFIITDNARSLGAILKGGKWIGVKDMTHKSLTTPEQLKINLINVGFNKCSCLTHGFPILNVLGRIFGKKIVRSPLGLGAEIICIAERME